MSFHVLAMCVCFRLGRSVPDVRLVASSSAREGAGSH